MSADGTVLVPGRPGEGPALVLTAPISFWGGVEAATGRIADVRHPQHGEDIAGTVLFLPGTIGSSSASAVLLELVSNGHAPAALVLHEADAILLLGLVVAREMGLETPVAIRLDRSLHAGYAGRRVEVNADGRVEVLEGYAGGGASSDRGVRASIWECGRARCRSGAMLGG